jgi:hypothetical protein
MLAVAALEHGDVVIGLVPEDRVQAVPAVIGRQQRPGVQTLTPHDQPAALRPEAQIKHVSDLTALAVLARRAVLVKCWYPHALGDLEDRGNG